MDTEKIENLIREEGERTRRHFDVVAEGLHAETRVIAEGVMAANERMDRHEETMRGEFAEVRAMMKLSYVELDRRVGQLETIVHELSARVHRIEARQTP